MAFALRISAKTTDGQEVKIEPSGWSIKQLLSTHAFTEDLSDYYLDYTLYVNKQGFLDIMKQQERNRKIPLDDNEFEILDNIRTSNEFDHLLDNLEEGAIIQIWIYEWESGLG
jgi:hypothetical protein